MFWCIGQMRVLGIMFLLLYKKADAKREMKTTKEHNYLSFSSRTQSRIAIIRIQNPPFSFLSFWKEWMRFTPQPMMTTSGMMYRRCGRQKVTFLGRIWGYCSNLRSQQVWESENWRKRWLTQITVVFMQLVECIGFLWVDQDSVSSYGQYQCPTRIKLYWMTYLRVRQWTRMMKCKKDMKLHPILEMSIFHSQKQSRQPSPMTFPQLTCLRD